MEGIVLVLMKDGEVLREVKYPTSLRKDFDVEDMETGAE